MAEVPDTINLSTREYEERLLSLRRTHALNAQWLNAFLRLNENERQDYLNRAETQIRAGDSFFTDLSTARSTEFYENLGKAVQLLMKEKNHHVRVESFTFGGRERYSFAGNRPARMAVRA